MPPKIPRTPVRKLTESEGTKERDLVCWRAQQANRRQSALTLIDKLSPFKTKFSDTDDPFSKTEIRQLKKLKKGLLEVHERILETNFDIISAVSSAEEAEIGEENESWNVRIVDALADVDIFLERSEQPNLANSVPTAPSAPSPDMTQVLQAFTVSTDLFRQNMNATPTAAQSSIRLPTLSIEPFSGDSLRWQQFFDSFSTSVHDNASLSDIEKFNYLKSCLRGPALRALDGLSISAENYGLAMTLLQNKYGDKNVMITTHILHLSNLNSVDDVTFKLERFHDEIESHYRSLNILLSVCQTCENSAYKRFLGEILLPKLPSKLREKVFKVVIADRNLLVDAILEVLNDEIKMRKAVDSSLPPHQKFDSQSQNPADKWHNSDSRQGRRHLSVNSNQSTPTCFFCSKTGHFSDLCHKFSTVESRREQCDQKRVCIICFKQNHNSRNCPNRKPCHYCRLANHHRSLCMKEFPHDSSPKSDFKNDKKSRGKKGPALVTGAKNDEKDNNSDSDSDRSDTEPVGSSGNDQTQTDKKPKPKPKHSVTTAVGESDSDILLLTAYVNAKNFVANKKVKCRFLLDTASMRSFVSKEFSENLGLKEIDTEVVQVSSFGKKRAKTQTMSIVEFGLQKVDGSYFCIRANVNDHITNPFARVKLDPKKYPILKSVTLAEPLSDSNDDLTIDVLVGNEYCFDIIEPQATRQLDKGLYLINTKFGYMPSGKLSSGKTTKTPMSSVNSVSVRTESIGSFEPSLEKFWSLETLGIAESGQLNDDEIAQDIFNSNISFNPDTNRYEIVWPWRDKTVELADNYNLSFHRLKTLITRLQSHPSLLEQYDQVFKKHLSLGIIEKVIPEMDDKQNKLYYIPHHCVVDLDRPTTKVRVVYDASSKARAKDNSLNDLLYRGPVGLEDLCGLLLRFRLRPVAILSDIEGAFLQIGVRPSERDVTRLLWLKNLNDKVVKDNIVTYRFACVGFGVVSSLFLLMATIRHHLKQPQIDCPEAREISENLYVDNVVTTKPNSTDALSFYKIAKTIFDKASMNLCQWCSNSEEFINQIPECDRAKGVIFKVLGLQWDTKNDTLSLKNPKLSEKVVETKRQLLKAVASIFDPTGIFSPFVASAKFLLHELSQDKLSWDEKLPPPIKERWAKLLVDLQSVHLLCIPRVTGPITGDGQTLQLHCFTDASMKSYSAVVYLVVSEAGSTQSFIIFAKNRLAPLKTITLPRLELMGVLIGTRILSFVTRELRCKIDRTVLWTDSECVLAWIGSSKILPTFVNNRVKEIKSHTHYEFRHVSSVDNPADIPTKPQNYCDLSNNKLWWSGPNWLCSNESNWPKNERNVDTPTNENVSGLNDTLTSDNVSGLNQTPVKSVVTVTHSSNTVNNLAVSPLGIDILKYSSLSKLLRVTAWVKRAAKNWLLLVKLKRDKNVVDSSKFTNIPTLDAYEIESAKRQWEFYAQSYFFSDIQSLLKRDKSNPLIFQLGLYLDESGLIRCKGRLQNTDLPFDTKHPKLLPKTSHFTKLAIIQCHELLLHSGVSQTLAQFWYNYWVTQGRRTVKSVLNLCKICKKQEGGVYQTPPPPSWPKFRVNYSIPFEYTGVDYLGPLRVQEQPKVWICLFTCASTRAVHLEVVKNLTTDEFIKALQRFISRRGRPKMLISDNAKHFKLADTSLKVLWKQLSIRESTVQNYVASQGMIWKFIVALSPWMGGFYERLVGSVKRSLKKMLDRKLVSFSELQTLIVQIEAILNSRPLTQVSEDINDK